MALCAEMMQILRFRGLRAKPKVYICRGGPAKNKSQVQCNMYEIIKETDVSNTVTAILIDVATGVKIGKKNLLKLVFHSSVKHAIVLLTEISHPAHKAILEITSKFIEIIKRHDIAWIKVNYYLVPHYEVLCEEHVECFEKERKMKRTNLSTMLITDPMAVQFGFRAGDVVHAIEYDTYRLVIAP